MNKLKKKMLVVEESLISLTAVSRVNPLTLGRCQKLKRGLSTTILKYWGLKMSSPIIIHDNGGLQRLSPPMLCTVGMLGMYLDGGKNYAMHCNRFIISKYI